MKEPGTVIFFLLVILGVIFEQIANFRKQQKKKNANEKTVQKRSNRTESMNNREITSHSEIHYRPDKDSQSTSLADRLTQTADALPIVTQSKNKKTVINLHHKNKLKEAYIMKAILDRPQAYKF